MSEYENFRDAVNGSEALTARWKSVSDAITETAAREGIVVTRQELMTLDSVRLHVLTGDEELGVNWRGEAEEKLPAFKQKSREFRDALNSANEAEAEKARSEILQRSPAERMRLARESGESHAKPVSTKKDLSVEERARVIAELDSAGIKGSERIRRARAAGLE